MPEIAIKEPSPQPSCAPAQASSAAPSHVRYLEGLRGLAAIVVTLQHLYYHTLGTFQLTGWQGSLSTLISWLLPGRAAVAVFIVLSGYLLMRPVSRAADGRMPGGTLAYLRRRARRILPPYYAALILTIGLILAVPALRTPISSEWSDAVPPLGARNLAAHFLLLHNLSYRWASKIDPPMWTIATEWQIYFLFPLVLLPVWRRLGNAGSVAAAFILGLGIFLVTGKGNAAAPWFLALFAMGAAAADWPPNSLAARRQVGWLAAILLAIFGVITFQAAFGMLRFLTVEGLPGLWPYYWIFDTIIGVSTMCFLIYAGANRSSLIVRFLSSRSLVLVGVASYSLYLIHDPVLALVKLLIDRQHLNPWMQFFEMLAAGGIIVAAATALFHVVFERPFMRSARVAAASR